MTPKDKFKAKLKNESKKKISLLLLTKMKEKGHQQKRKMFNYKLVSVMSKNDSIEWEYSQRFGSLGGLLQSTSTKLKSKPKDVCCSTHVI